jgi:hypothetical protein
MNFTKLLLIKTQEKPIAMKLRPGLFCLLILVSSDQAFAYLDPGTGSMLLQVILGGVAAVGVVIKLYWHRFRVAIGMGRKKNADPESD